MNCRGNRFHRESDKSGIGENRETTKRVLHRIWEKHMADVKWQARKVMGSVLLGYNTDLIINYKYT